MKSFQIGEYHPLYNLYTHNQGVLEEDNTDGEFGIISKGSKINFKRDGSGKGRKFQRKGTLNHVRDSVRSTRSDVLSRGNSITAIAVEDGVMAKSSREVIHLEEIPDDVFRPKADKE